MGVKVTLLEKDEWPGPARITRELTPAKVRIQNDGSKPVIVAYDRFVLVGEDGTSYQALPLFRLERSKTSGLIVRDPFEIRQHRFESQKFLVAPAYRGIYSGLPLFDGSQSAFSPDISAYDRHYSGKPLPTTEMRRRGIPEGVLLPGGFVEGFLYFEEVESPKDRVALYLNVVEPATGTPLGQVQATR